SRVFTPTASFKKPVPVSALVIETVSYSYIRKAHLDPLFWIYIIFAVLVMVIFWYYIDMADWTTVGAGIGEFSPKWGNKKSTIALGILFLVFTTLSAYCAQKEFQDITYRTMNLIVFIIQLVLMAGLAYTVSKKSFK